MLFLIKLSTFLFQFDGCKIKDKKCGVVLKTMNQSNQALKL